MKNDVDPDLDDAFDEPTAVSKVNAGPNDPDDTSTGLLESGASIGGNSALSDDQIFESMPRVSESIARAPKKLKEDDWASSSEFDAFGEMDSRHAAEQGTEAESPDAADDQDFDAPTGVHTRTPTPPPDPQAPERLPAAGFQVLVKPHEMAPEPLAFEEAREELYAADSAFDEQLHDEFAVEVEAPVEIEAEEAAPSADEPTEDEAWGTILEQAWAPCEPQRDLPSKLQRVAFAEAAVKIQTILAPNRELQKAKNDLLAKLNAQVTAQEGLVSYTPDWRACDKALGTLLPKLERLVASTDAKIPASKFRGAYLAHTFHLATCLNYFEHEIRSGDHGISWWERISPLAVASATRVLPNGDRELLPVIEVVKLWNGRLPAQQVQRSTIVAAARFFQESIAKLTAVTNPDDYFKSGLALEVIGYQVSLREDIFRPEVLYAATDFHTQLSNWLNSDAVRPLRGKLDGEFTGTYEKAASIFGL